MNADPSEDVRSALPPDMQPTWISPLPTDYQTFVPMASGTLVGVSIECNISSGTELHVVVLASVGDGAWSVLGNLVAMWAPSQTAEEYAIVQLNATGSITLAAGATYRLVFQFVSSTNTSGFIALASETYRQGSFVMAGVDYTGWDAVFTTYMGL